MKMLIQWWRAKKRWRYIRTEQAEWTKGGKTFDVLSYHLFENGLGERKCKCFGLWAKQHKHYETVIYPWLKGANRRLEPKLRLCLSAGKDERRHE